MPITLITGTPGHGKTLFMIEKLVKQLLPLNRPIFHNIEGLTYERAVKVVGAELAANIQFDAEIDPFNWMDAPIGSIFIFDECQREFPPRNPQAKVPPHVGPLAVHRKQGYDFFFITQHPSMIDTFLINLGDEHFHVYRLFNSKRSTVLHWRGVNRNPAPLQTRSSAEQRLWKYPVKLFDMYQSAALHTIRRVIPWRIISVFGLVLVGAIAVAWVGKNTLARYAASDPVELKADELLISNCYEVFAVVRGAWLVRMGGGVYTVPETYITNDKRPSDGYCPTEPDGQDTAQAVPGLEG